MSEYQKVLILLIEILLIDSRKKAQFIIQISFIYGRMNFKTICGIDLLVIFLDWE